MQMSTCIVKDTELVDVHPLQLHFTFRPNKFISCPFHVTNNMDDQHVSVRCVPKHEEATCYYYARLRRIVGVVPPRSTHTFVVTMKEVQQPPANMDVLDIVVETILGEVSLDYQFETYFKDARKENSRGFREVTLKAVCATTSETMTSEVSCFVLMDLNVIKETPAYPLLFSYVKFDPLFSAWYAACFDQPCLLQVILHGVGHLRLISMDVHPTEPW
jgi:hypothetical protein